eukprot:SAG31_NODE_764_length_12262_cov_26.578887_8_plen_46_part_00
MGLYIGFNIVQTLFGVGRQVCFSIVSFTNFVSAQANALFTCYYLR